MPSQRASQKATPRRIVSPEEEVDELADDSSSSEESGSDEGEEWEARAILDERTVRDPSANRSRRAGSSSSRAKSSSAPRTITQYLIDWEGFDPATGKRWKPTWENAEGATQGLVDDWKKRKAEDPDLFGRYSRNLEEQKWRVVSPEKPKTKSASKQGSSSKSKSLNMAGGVASDSHRSVPAQEPTPRSTQGKRQKSVTSVPPAGSQTATGGKRKRSPHKRTSPPPPLSSSVSPPSQWGSAYGRAKRQKINVPIKPATQFTHTSKGDSPRPPESPSVVDDSQPLLPLTSSDERSAVLNSASTPLPVITTQPVSSRRQSKSKVPASPLSPPPTAAPNDTSTHSANPPPPPVVQDPRASRNHRPQPTDAGSSAESEPEASLDVSASQAEALRRAIDLLMDEEEFLEERERQSSVVVGASHEQAPAPAQVQAQAGQMPTAEKSAAAAGAGAAVEEKSGEPSIHTGKSTIQLLHPVPQITPTAFHELGMHTSAVGDSFTTSNTQPPEESILDFDDSATQGVHPSATILQPDVSGTEILQTEEMRVEAADRVTPSGTRELDGEMAAVDMEDSAESLVPVLGEDNWSRILGSSTIDPAMLGNPSGAMDDQNFTSSDDDSLRSGSHDAARQVKEDEVASYVALIKTLELELLRERERSRQERENEQEEKRQLEDDLKAMTSNYEGSQNQYALMQDLYSRASDTTMRLNRENEQLREENETIKEQLTVGLKQKELFYQAIIDAKDQELTEATTQRDVLMQQAAKTGDAIREKAGQSQFLKVELQDALTRIAACDRCSKVTQSDEESDYNPTQEDSFVPGEPRVMRTRRNDAAVTEQAPEAQEKPRDGNARLHASPDPLSPIRKQYPLNSFERWTRAPNKLFPAVKPLVEKTFDMDIKSVNMVYMCRWRPAHGNLCSALFATREHLAEHAVDHLNDKEE